jgi:hypothetical protein
MKMDLPVSRAFLVRFSRDSDSTHERFCGRVEHVKTGQRAPFSSSEELNNFVIRILETEGDSRHTTPVVDDPDNRRSS